MQGQDRPQTATAHGHGQPEHQAHTPTSPANGAGAGAGASASAGTMPVKANVKPPSEEELRNARDVINRAKQTGVKLQPGGGAGQARIMLPNGEARSDYIKRRWKDGVDMPTILKEIQSAGPDYANTKYQVVFAACKGIEGGPKKAKAGDGEKPTYSLAPKPADTSASA
jgi:hypothetical protein